MRPQLLFIILLASCSSGPDADLPAIGQARSLAAEWALINQQAGEGKLTSTYANSMRRQLRKQLETTASSLKHPDSRYGQEVHALLSEPDDAAPQELRSHSDSLKQIEDSLESA